MGPDGQHRSTCEDRFTCNNLNDLWNKRVWGGGGGGGGGGDVLMSCPFHLLACQ